jgi:hypothetical protein
LMRINPAGHCSGGTIDWNQCQCQPRILALGVLPQPRAFHAAALL